MLVMIAIVQRYGTKVSLAVIKKKKEGDIYEKNSSKKGICSSVRTYYVW